MRLLPIVFLSGAALLFAGQVCAGDDVTVIARAKQVVSNRMKDPNSSQFKDVGSFKSGTVCGTVNAKNAYGAYVGFRRFVVAGGMPFVRDAEHAAEQKAFDDVWDHFCAA